MSNLAFYDVLYIYKDLHRNVLGLAESLTDEQLRWLPEGYSTSIGFHLWHLARESDYLRARILERVPQLGPDFGEAQEIWHKEKLAEKWGFPLALGQTVGTGLSDEDSASLPLPSKEELLDYLRRSYQAVEQFVELLDQRYPSFEHVDDELRQKIQNIRLNILVFLAHDGRHLGMMECLKGLLTGFGSATEQRR
jgi:hypothetical protein